MHIEADDRVVIDRNAALVFVLFELNSTNTIRPNPNNNCWNESVTYTLWCNECDEEVAAYKGESGRNGFTRGVEHLDSWEACDKDKSVLWLLSVHHHQSRQDVNYIIRVTGTFKDPLDRQIMERIQIQNFQGSVLMNRRTEMQYRPVLGSWRGGKQPGRQSLGGGIQFLSTSKLRFKASLHLLNTRSAWQEGLCAHSRESKNRDL